MKCFTKEWYIKSQGSQGKIEEAINLCSNYFNSIEKLLPEDFIDRKFFMHDYKLYKKYFSDNNFVLEFKAPSKFLASRRITFINSKVLNFDNILIGSYWIYNEIYITDNQYEICILFNDEDDLAKEFKIIADSVLVEEI